MTDSNMYSISVPFWQFSKLLLNHFFLSFLWCL